MDARHELERNLAKGVDPSGQSDTSEASTASAPARPRPGPRSRIDRESQGKRENHLPVNDGRGLLEYTMAKVAAVAWVAAVAIYRGHGGCGGFGWYVDNYRRILHKLW